MKTQKENQTILLRDGRRLHYAEYGDPEGKPVFYFPGGTASGLIARTIDKVAWQTNTRIISPNRPGIGLSDFKAGRSLLDWADDICELADALNIERFAVMSESGGAPYVAACAKAIPDRLTTAVIVSGTCPFDVPGVMQGMSPQNRSSMKFMQTLPVWLIRLIFLPMALTTQRNPEKLRPQLLQLAEEMPEADRDVFSKPEYLQAVLEAYCEAFQQGTRGAAQDLKLCAGAWGGWLPDISIEVQLWHGEKDTNAPIAMAHYMQRTIPKTRATFIPGEGHVSLMHNLGGEILAAL